jgi:hypothetical protein
LGREFLSFFGKNALELAIQFSADGPRRPSVCARFFIKNDILGRGRPKLKNINSPEK